MIHTLVAVVLSAAMFVAFGLAARAFAGCGGPEHCSRTEGQHGCGACPKASGEDGHV